MRNSAGARGDGGGSQSEVGCVLDNPGKPVRSPRPFPICCLHTSNSHPHTVQRQGQVLAGSTPSNCTYPPGSDSPTPVESNPGARGARTGAWQDSQSLRYLPSHPSHMHAGSGCPRPAQSRAWSEMALSFPNACILLGKTPLSQWRVDWSKWDGHSKK